MKKILLTAVAATMLSAPAFATPHLSDDCSSLLDVSNPETFVEALACQQHEYDGLLAKESGRVDTYIAAWEEAKDKVAELHTEVAILEQSVIDASTNQNDQIQALAQYNADLKAEVAAVKAERDVIKAEVVQLQADYDFINGVAVQLQTYGQDVGDVIAKYNTNDAKRWFKPSDRAAFINDLYTFLTGRLADLQRSEDRIRDLEKKIDWFKSGGHWNPQNW